MLILLLERVVYMALEAENAGATLRSMWEAQGDPAVALDEDCNPNKVCKNMAGITFDGYAEEGADIRVAWREKLAREGKLNTSGGSIRDLVLGPVETR
ncbi:unannotated protein [freshwater metagenome]|uniref:Unannotated protein n=1 Tax=freshwater metagenome TaxID=449393 RepID=A0A6J7FS02_9ZZZZ|nr:hypothetical protein [Actinomycetota bacterium]